MSMIKLRMPDRFFTILYGSSQRMHCFNQALMVKIPFEECDDIGKYYSDLINEYLKYYLVHSFIERDLMKELNIETYTKAIMYDVYVDECKFKPFTSSISDSEFFKDRALRLLYKLKSSKPDENFNNGREKLIFIGIVQSLIDYVEHSGFDISLNHGRVIGDEF